MAGSAGVTHLENHLAVYQVDKWKAKAEALDEAWGTE